MADSLYLLKVHGNHAGQHSEVGLYFHGSNLTQGEVYDNAVDLIDGFNTNCKEAFLDTLPFTYHIERISARRIIPAGGVEAVLQFQDLDFPGELGTGAASNQLCPMVRLIPPMGTKSAGKFFMPCIAEESINANVPTAQWVTDIGVFVNTMLSNIGNNSIVWLLAVYSTKLGTYVDAVTHDLSPTVGWQRRRGRPT